MSAIDDLWLEAKKDNDTMGDELLKPLVEWRGRGLMRLREALELGHAQGCVDTRSAAEAALMEACVSLGVPSRTTDSLIKAVRDARVSPIAFKGSRG